MDSISPLALRKVTRELYTLKSNPPEGIRLVLNEDSMTDIQAWIQGPDGTPYEGGYFRLRIQLSADFPNSPPKCFFITKIFHPNVSKQGDVCVSTLKKDWKKDLGIGHILLVVKCLLIFPNPESALNEEAGRQLLERYDDYAKHARLMTGIHATSVGQDLFTNHDTDTGDGDVNSATHDNNNNNNLENRSVTKSTIQKAGGSGRNNTLPPSDPDTPSSITAEQVSKIPGGVIGGELISVSVRDINDTTVLDIINSTKSTLSTLVDSTASALSLKRKLPQEERSAEQSSHSKCQLSECKRQTLQGLSTKQNQTPAWNTHSLKQQAGHTKHDVLKDKTHDNTIKTAIGSKSIANQKILIDRKKGLRRL